MKNSEKLIQLLWFLGFVLFLIYIGLKTTIILFIIAFILFYLILTVTVFIEFPLKKRLYYKNEVQIIRECKEYIKNANIELITITYWWCRFLYYLDYELNKTKNEE